MPLHVLPGDSVYDPFIAAGIPGDVAVFRECFVDGPSDADSIEELFSLREAYLDPFNPGFYSSHVRPEIDKILQAESGADLFLWFEHELFCQVNLWFLLHHLSPHADLYAVTPDFSEDRNRFRGWRDHGPVDLKARLSARERISGADRELGSQLWTAYSSGNTEVLLELGKRDADAFRFLGEVAEAAATVESRPEEILREFAGKGMRFGEAFQAFCETAPVYGFGDLQVKRIWDSLAEG